MSVCLTGVSNRVHQGCPGKRPWKRLKVSCELVKHLVTSHLVRAETEGCNRLLRRGCAVLKLSGKEVVGMREILAVRRTHNSACCARANLRLTYLHLHAALLLPPELLASVGKCGFCCQAAVGCLLGWELFEEPAHMTRQRCLLCLGSLATFPFTTGTWCYGFSCQTLEVILSGCRAAGCGQEL